MNMQEKQDLATTYMQAYVGDVDIGSGVNHRMLGIQYWFYYPFHDDPEGANHQHDWWYFWVVYDMTDKKPTKAIYDFHHNVRVKDFSKIEKEDGFHPKVYCDAGGHRSLWAAGDRDVKFNIDITDTVKSGITIESVNFRLGSVSKDPTFDLMLVGQSAANILKADYPGSGGKPFDMDIGVVWRQGGEGAWIRGTSDIVDNENILKPSQITVKPQPIEDELWNRGREGDKANDRKYLEEGGDATKPLLDPPGRPEPKDLLAEGQNGHWRATDTTFNEQKDATTSKVITWKAETFNMVWVYDTKDNTEKPEPQDSPVYDIDQRYVVVGYTGDNIPGVDDTTVKYYNYWQSTDANAKGTYLPWLTEKTNTVTQAWEWNTAGTHNSPQSPIRSEIYSDPSTGANNQNVMDFARGAGDNDGRWIP